MTTPATGPRRLRSDDPANRRPAGTTDAVDDAVVPGRRGRWVLVAFLAWTAFVWVGRVRNALADPALDGGGRTGPLLLSASFLVPAAVAAVLLVAGWRRPATGALRAVVVALAAWTTAVWVVRVADIALGGDHDAAFVAVHSVLGVVSVVLGVVAARRTTAD